MDSAIPEDVLEALELVRSEGQTNMLDRQFVIVLAEPEYPDAAEWLTNNRNRYMEALKAMGERRTKA